MGDSCPEVWLAIPSASVERCRARLPRWREMGYRVAVLQNRERGDIPADLVEWTSEYPGWAASVNHLCASLVPASADIVVTGGDDMLPDPGRTSGAIGAEMLEHFGGSFGVMQPAGDGLLGAIAYCGSPWLGRVWIERAYGGRGPMPSGYRHNWADGELYWVARCLDALWMREDLTQRHEHFSRDGESPPDWWTSQVDAHDRRDVQLFLARAWEGFPGCEPIGMPRQFDHERFQQEYDHRAEAHWISRFGRSIAVSEPERRLALALDSCARRGHRRVAIFGAGSHTRLASGALMNPPVEIVCLIDDDPGLTGTRLWNYPIFRRSGVDPARCDAVILSSRSMERHLANLAEPWSALGVEVIELYSDAPVAAGAWP